eukprot:3542157-Rhodomonas_salina.4
MVGLEAEHASTQATVDPEEREREVEAPRRKSPQLETRRGLGSLAACAGSGDRSDSGTYARGRRAVDQQRRWPADCAAPKYFVFGPSFAAGLSSSLYALLPSGFSCVDAAGRRSRVLPHDRRFPPGIPTLTTTTIVPSGSLRQAGLGSHHDPAVSEHGSQCCAVEIILKARNSTSEGLCAAFASACHARVLNPLKDRVCYLEFEPQRVRPFRQRVLQADSRRAVLCLRVQERAQAIDKARPTLPVPAAPIPDNTQRQHTSANKSKGPSPRPSHKLRKEPPEQRHHGTGR